MKKFNYSKQSIFKFYFFYLFYKLLIPFEVKKGKINIIVAEFIWVSSKLFRFKPFLFKNFTSNYYETKFGKFYINPDLISTIAASPSFERKEIEILLKMIESDVSNNKKILFIDVGAFFGLYTVLVGNRYKKYKNLDIMSFEPDTFYLSDATFNLIKKNIKVNNIKNSKLYHFGLGSINSNKKNKKGIITKKLDTVLTKKILVKYDSVYIKIDVDGSEKDVLLGAKSSIKNAKEITLLIEDFVDQRIVKYLSKDFEFISKPSSYNSFWKKK